MITLPTTLVADLSSNITTVFADLAPLIVVAVGVPFAIYIVKLAVSFLPKAKASK